MGTKGTTGRMSALGPVAAAVCAIPLFLALSADGAGPAVERMRVRGVISDPRRRMPVLVLEDVKTGRKILPLWIGASEAKAILMALRHVSAPRPMTHDLLRNLLRDLKARVLRITITELRENTFIAAMTLRAGDKILRVDSRPSDAVALALRTDAPIFVATGVLARAGHIQPEDGSMTSVVPGYGLSVQEITGELLPHFRGARIGSILITHVRLESRGARDGLKRGDVVLQVNDLSVRGLKNFMHLMRSARSRNEAVRLSIHRGENRLGLTLSRP